MADRSKKQKGRGFRESDAMDVDDANILDGGVYENPYGKGGTGPAQCRFLSAVTAVLPVSFGPAYLAVSWVRADPGKHSLTVHILQAPC